MDQDDFHAKHSVYADDTDANATAEAREVTAACAAAATIAERDAAGIAARSTAAALEACARARCDVAAAALASRDATAARDAAAAAADAPRAEVTEARTSIRVPCGAIVLFVTVVFLKKAVFAT